MTFWLKHFDKQYLHAYQLCILCHTPVAFPPVLIPGLCPPGRWFSLVVLLGLEEDRMGDFTLYMYMYTLLVHFETAKKRVFMLNGSRANRLS